MPLKKVILAAVKIVSFLNGNGCDVRRENLKGATTKEVSKERRVQRKDRPGLAKGGRSDT